MNSAILLRIFLVVGPTAAAIVTGYVGYSGVLVGWVFCAYFAATEAYIVGVILHEQSETFRSSLTKINALDLTYRRDLPTTDGRLRVSDHICTQFAWLARHRN